MQAGAMDMGMLPGDTEQVGIREEIGIMVAETGIMALDTLVLPQGL